MEGRLLAAAIASRTAYDSIQQLGAHNDLTELGKQLWKRLAAYYERDISATSADTELLLEQLVRAHPAHQEKFEALISNLPSVSPPNVVDYCKEHRLSCLGLAIQNALDKSDSDKAGPLMEEYITLQKVGFTSKAGGIVGAKVYQGVSSHQLKEELNKGSGLKLYPSSLSKIVYDILPGDHILVYAAPETGKSLTAITMACGFAYQKKKVLYIGNEDPAMRMIGRIKSCLSGMTKEQRDANPDECDARAKARGFDNIVFVELSPGSLRDVEQLIAEHKPDVCVVDQVLNLSIGGKEPSKTEMLEHVCQRLRMLYKSTGVIGVSISQASETAINKLQLSIKDVYYSNIGVQGQVDVMIGVGMNGDFEASGRRYLNVTKNKASGKHLGCTVRANFGISKLEDLNK